MFLQYMRDHRKLLFLLALLVIIFTVVSDSCCSGTLCRTIVLRSGCTFCHTGFSAVPPPTSPANTALFLRFGFAGRTSGFKSRVGTGLSSAGAPAVLG